MAEVFLAASRGPTGFNKLVVLKQLRQHLCEDSSFVELFVGEARLAARLHHPNVVQTYEIGTQDQRHFIAMEYLDGQPLHRLLKRAASQGGLPLTLQLYLLREALAGLHYAHELADFDGSPLGIVHRDVSPQNLFVTYDGYVKLVDFGVAKSGLADTTVGIVKGKLTYMAPEQALARKVDHRADLFALGVMFWETLTGRRLWHQKRPEEILLALRGDALPRAREANADVPAMLDAICARAMALEPERRFASALEFKAALDYVAEHLGARAGAHELGALTASLFFEDRSKVRALIQEELTRLQATPSWTARPVPSLEEGSRGPSSSSYVVTSDPQSAAAPLRPTLPRWVPWVAASAIGAAAATGALALRTPPNPAPAAAAVTTAAAVATAPVAASEPARAEAPPTVSAVPSTTSSPVRVRAAAVEPWPKAELEPGVMLPGKARRQQRKIDKDDPWSE